MSQNSKQQKRDVYQIVTDRIIEQLEKGTVPWKQPWTDAGLPQNLITKRPYRGINVWLLSMLGFARNFFLTARQIKEKGWTVKENEKPFPVVYWNWKDVMDEDSGEKRDVPFIRYYTVFNVDQCDGLPEGNVSEIPEKVVNPIAECEAIILDMPRRPEIKNKEQKAYYNPLLDFVNLPRRNTFESAERYYDTLFHELAHSTGHLTRLNRKELMQMAEFGSEAYSIEELIAEMTACFIKSVAGWSSSEFEENASYIAGWLQKLKDDKRFVIYAASQAQRASDYILNVPIKVKEIMGANEEVGNSEEVA